MASSDECADDILNLLGVMFVENVSDVGDFEFLELLFSVKTLSLVLASVSSFSFVKIWGKFVAIAHSVLDIYF